jgi:dihydropteroate synthase
LKKLTDVPLSIDTWKAPVAKATIEAGADIINDITGFLGDPDMAKVVGNSKAGAILMFNPAISRPDHPGSKIFPSFGVKVCLAKKRSKE